MFKVALKKYIFRSLIFTLSFLIIYYIYIRISNYYLNQEIKEDTIFIWGDSQMQYGLDLKQLEKETGKKVYSSAYSGAGVYDFIAFANLVKKNSFVIINFSKPLLLRRKEHDKNKLIFDLNALFRLSKNNYNLNEIMQITINNRIPSKVFYESNDQILYDCEDTIFVNESIDFIRKSFQNSFENYDNKHNLYLEGINILNSKGCKIVLLSFPFHKVLEKVEIQTGVLKNLNKTNLELTKKLNISKSDTLVSNLEYNLMYDYTHLNKKGANYFTKLVSRSIINNLSSNNRHFVLIIE
jgi:hypothetical protein